MLLSGRDPDELGARDLLDVAEATLIDSFVHGLHSLDDVMAKVHAALDERFPDPSTWGLLPHQRASAAAAEAMFPPRRSSSE